MRHAVISPGSRSTPLALAISACSSIAVHIFHDERSASFAALGIALETKTPAILLCTSGTAAAEFHAAAVEAHHAEVPMLLCTAMLEHALIASASGVLRDPGETTAWRTPRRAHSSTSVAQNVAVVAGDDVTPLSWHLCV